MKSSVRSIKDSYIYKISKEIHKVAKIISNPLEKLADHCVEHKINMRNDEGYIPQSQLCSATPLPFSFISLGFELFLCFYGAYGVSFVLVFMVYIEFESRGVDQLAQASCNQPKQVGCLGLKKFDQPKRASCQSG